MTVVHATRAGKRYGDKCALRHVDLTVRRLETPTPARTLAGAGTR